MKKWTEVELGGTITGDATYSFALATNSKDSVTHVSSEGTHPPQLVVVAG